MIASVGFLLLGRLSLEHPAIASPARRSVVGKALARQVFRMTGEAQMGDPSFVMRQPILANMIWQLRDALTLEHWIRDDADFVRGQVMTLLRSGMLLFARALAQHWY